MTYCSANNKCRPLPFENQLNRRRSLIKHLSLLNKCRGIYISKSWNSTQTRDEKRRFQQSISSLNEIIGLAPMAFSAVSPQGQRWLFL